MALYEAEARLSLQDQISGPWRSMASKLRGSANTLQSTVGRAFSGMRMRVNRAIRGIINPIKTLLPILGAAGLAMEFRNVVREAAGFSEQMAKVGTMLNNVTMTIMPQFRKEIAAMSTQFGRSTKDLADGLYNVLSAGVPAARAVQHLKTVTLGAIGGFAPLGEVARAVSAIMNGFTRENVSAARAVDVLSAIVEGGITTMGELAPTIGTVTGFAGKMGVKFNELAGMIATVSKSGRGTGPVMISIRALLASMLKPTEENADAINMLNKVMKDKGILGFARALKEANLSAEEMVKIFPNIRAKLALDFLTSDVKGLEKEISRASNSLGLAGRKADQMMQSAAFRMAKMREEFNAARRLVGEALLPGIFQAFNTITGVLKAKTVQNALRSIGEIIGEILSRMVKIGATIGMLASGAQENVKTLQNYLLGQWEILTAQVLKTFKGLIAAGMALISSAVSVAFGNGIGALDELTETFMGALDTAINYWEATGRTLENEALLGATGFLKEIDDVARGHLDKGGKDLKKGARGLIDELKDMASDALGDIKTGLGELGKMPYRFTTTAPRLFGPEESRRQQIRRAMGMGIAGVERMVMGIVPERIGAGFGGRGMMLSKRERFIRQYGPEEGARMFREEQARQARLAPQMAGFRERMMAPAMRMRGRMERMIRTQPTEFARRVTEQMGRIQEALPRAVLMGQTQRAEAMRKRIEELGGLRERVEPYLKQQVKHFEGLAEFYKKEGMKTEEWKARLAAREMKEALGEKVEDPVVEAISEASDKLRKAVEKEMSEQSKAIMGVGATMWGGASLKDVVEAIKNIKAIAKAQAIAISEGGRVVEETNVAPDTPQVNRTWTEPRSAGTPPA